MDPHFGVYGASIASVWPGWVTRENMRRLISVPFLQFGARKLIVLISVHNERSRRLARGWGFKQEAQLRHHFSDGAHAQVWSMMRSEFDAKWALPGSFIQMRALQRKQRTAAVEALI